jgi:hypothetical protein
MPRKGRIDLPTMMASALPAPRSPSNFDPNAISGHGFAPARSGGASIPAGRFLPPRYHGCLAADPAFLMEAGHPAHMELAVHENCPHVSGGEPLRTWAGWSEIQDLVKLRRRAPPECGWPWPRSPFARICEAQHIRRRTITIDGLSLAASSRRAMHCPRRPPSTELQRGLARRQRQ